MVLAKVGLTQPSSSAIVGFYNCERLRLKMGNLSPTLQ
jgi:hypothetical protein